jgi:hypothetical protein
MDVPLYLYRWEEALYVHGRKCVLHQSSPRDSTAICNQNENVAYNDRIARHTY